MIISYDELSHGDSPEWREILAREKEIFGDPSGATELVVGKNTRRLYPLVFTRDGPKLSDRRETIVDQYDEPVEIQPPPNVPPPTAQTSGSSCPEPPGDIPWLPAAAAAVLGPLLFLVGSAFLWPRRL